MMRRRISKIAVVALAVFSLATAAFAARGHLDEGESTSYRYQLSGRHEYRVSLHVHNDDALFDLHIYHDGEEIVHKRGRGHRVSAFFTPSHSGSYIVRVSSRHGHGDFHLNVGLAHDHDHEE